MPIVTIDPGHNSSGADTGAQGNGLKEQDITLDIATRLKPLLENKGISVIMTRTGESVPKNDSLYNSLKYRCDVANNSGSDLFVSIHVNAGGGDGTEVHAYAAGGNGERCAKIVLPYLLNACGWSNRGVKFSNFQVLRETNMPAILTENGFIDNADNASKLSKPEFRQAIAEAHAQGICAYFGIDYTKGDVKVAETQTTNEDPDVYLTVRVRTSKADALIQQIIQMGYACKKLDLA